MSEQPSSVALTLRRLLRRLAQFRPFSDQSQLEHSAREFILAAIYESGGSVSSRAECQEILRNLWSLSFELEEISAVTDRLIRSGKLVEEHEHLQLSESCARSIGERVRMSKEVETTALAEWEQEVHRRFPSLSQSQITLLREDLVAWVQQLVAEYGVEAATLLQPRHHLYTHYLQEAAASCDVMLPEREPALAIMRIETLVMFFEEPTQTQMQRHYFENLLATAYLLSVFTLDPAALDGVQRLTNGQRLYLDTNLVYSLLRLNGAERYLFVKRILNLSFRLGYQVCVTPWTLAEMQESVRLARERLARERPSPQDLADLEFESDEAFVRGYRKLERESGLNLDDYNALPRHIEQLLAREGIEIVDEGCQEIEAAADRFDEQISALERQRKGAEKPRPLQEHDVKHLMLMRLLRGSVRRRFSNVGYMLLSNDHALCRRAEADRERRGAPPCVISLAKWAHVTRSLVPRTNDFDKTLADMHRTPAVRPSSRVSQAEIVAAQARIGKHEKYSEAQTLLKMLNTALGGDETPDAGNGQLDGNDADAQRRKTETARIIELEGRVRELYKQAALELDRREAERTEHVRKEATRRHELDLERRRRTTFERQHNRLRERLERQSKQMLTRSPINNSAGVAALDRTLQMEHELEDIKKQLKRSTWLIGALIALAGVAVGILPWASGLISGVWPFVADACGGFALLLGAVGWIYGARAASAAFTAIGVTLGIVVALHSLTPDQPNPSTARPPGQTPATGSRPSSGTLKGTKQNPRQHHSEPTRHALPPRAKH
jgi:hypothetical protein